MTAFAMMRDLVVLALFVATVLLWAAIMGQPI